MYHVALNRVNVFSSKDDCKALDIFYSYCEGSRTYGDVVYGQRVELLKNDTLLENNYGFCADDGDTED